MSVLRHARCALSLLALALTTSWLAADDRTASDLLPESTIAFVEVRQPETLVATILEHPLRSKLLALPQVRTSMENKQFRDLKAGIAIIEAQFAMDWDKIVRQGVGGGIAFGVDSKTGGAALLVKANDDTTHSKILEIVLTFARADATSKGQPDPVKTAEYRGKKAYEAGGARLVLFDRWLLVTNKDELGKQIVDAWLEAPAKPLAKDSQFAAARAAAPSDASVWAYVNTAAIRDAGLAKELYKGQADNPAAELLFGGVLSNLQRTPYATASVRLDADKLEATLASVHDRSWIPEQREYFFGPQGQGRAPAPLLGEEALFSVRAYRDVSGMWLRAGDLFDEKANEELAKADSTLSTLFGGKDFGEDILGTLKPEIQIVVTRQPFGSDQPTPAIRLPTFALVSDLKEPQKMQAELRRTFQSLIGFLNVVGAMNGQPQLDLDMEKTDSSQIVIARYLADPNAKDPLGLKINYNFSPTIAFSGERVILSSTEGLAKRLVAAQTHTTASTATKDSGEFVVNTEAKLHFAALRDALADNQSQLVAQNMLKEGQTKEEAEAAIQTLLDLIGWLDQATVQMGTTDRELRVSFDVNLKPSAN